MPQGRISKGGVKSFMAQFTKQAIMQTFMLLIDEKPFDKITVTDIVERCGINRNTFYYHYPDLYALVDDLFRSEAKKIIDAQKDYAAWMGGFLAAVEFTLDNKRAILNIYNSVSRDRLEKYLYDVAKSTITQFVREQAEGLDAAEEDIETLSMFYSVALAGLAAKWLQSGMKNDIVEIFGRLNVLLDGDIRASLAKRKRSPKKP